MRNLRRAMQQIDDIVAQELAEIPKIALGPVSQRAVDMTVRNLWERIKKELKEMQDKTRTHLLICGLEIPLADPLAVEILACSDCDDAVYDTVAHEELPGVVEDAFLECCIPHSHLLVQWKRECQPPEFGMHFGDDTEDPPF